MMTDEEFKQDFERRFSVFAARMRAIVGSGGTGGFSEPEALCPSPGEITRYTKLLTEETARGKP